MKKKEIKAVDVKEYIKRENKENWWNNQQNYIKNREKTKITREKTSDI